MPYPCSALQVPTRGTHMQLHVGQPIQRGERRRACVGRAHDTCQSLCLLKIARVLTACGDASPPSSFIPACHTAPRQSQATESATEGEAKERGLS
eukprot:5467093-Prymnesium_polylepis.1